MEKRTEIYIMLTLYSICLWGLSGLFFLTLLQYISIGLLRSILGWFQFVTISLCIAFYWWATKRNCDQEEELINDDKK